METFCALLALCAGNSPVYGNSPHKGQWCGALMFSFICAWINHWVNNREAGDLRRHHTHYDVNVMCLGHSMTKICVKSSATTVLTRIGFVCNVMGFKLQNIHMALQSLTPGGRGKLNGGNLADDILKRVFLDRACPFVNSLTEWLIYASVK